MLPDVKLAAKLISQHIDFATCIQCCKYYATPETALCGHSLCHLCWKTNHHCPSCGKALEKKSLILNMNVKIITDHIKDLVNHFEGVYGVKMEELDVDEYDKAKNVNEWLLNSQNHFSAPPFTETQSTLELPVVVNSKIQVHTETNKRSSPPKVVHVPPPQDDWDVIETMPNTEDVQEKNKENIVGPMDLEPFFIDENEYTTNHPRRSSRKRDLTPKKDLSKTNTPKKREVSVDKQSSNNSSMDPDKKLDKAKQSWRNVKKMRKEFSKLNKEKSKLNVSIEMCKKSKSAVSKQASVTPPQPSPIKVYTIEENTQEVLEDIENSINKDPQPETSKILNNNKIVDESNKDDKIMDMDEEDLPDIDLNKLDTVTSQNKPSGKKKVASEVAKEITKDDSKTEISTKKTPFLKKSTLQNVSKDENHTVTVNHNNLPDNSTSNSNDDDIHITIKIGSVVTNITINKKHNDVQLKVNANREVQASLGPNGFTNTTIIDTEKKVVDSKSSQTQTDKNTIVNPTNNNTETVLNDKSCSTKKHTASAETATVQYEITESVEKELSNVMECIEGGDHGKVLSQSNKAKQNSQKTGIDTKTQTIEPNDVIKSQGDGFDDIDIFNSGSVKEVQALESSRGQPSEILAPTNKTRTRSQKSTDKRTRDTDSIKTTAKRQKLESRNQMLDMSSENYDAIMSQVFANIDEDMVGGKSKTQTLAKNTETQVSIEKPSQIMPTTSKTVVATQKDTENVDIPKQNINQKYSENMFSTIGNIENIPGPETQKNIDNLLTPGMCRDLDASNIPKDTSKDRTIADDMLMDICTPAQEQDDDDRSVVEDTPQKNLVNKSNQDNRTVLSNKKISAKPKPSDSEDIINITDTANSAKDIDVTIIDPNSRNVTETPLTINKFVNQISHYSTPVARKSLQFTKDAESDNDVTLCQTNEVAKTTQEKILMSEAFATTPVRKPLQAKNNNRIPKKFIVAGSCLSAVQSTNLKILCYKKKWLFIDKYTPELTHLVVGVDEENRAQRSVKYMCALAAGKWIVSYKWVEMSLEANNFVNEEPFEALDSTGDSGPHRSRVCSRKVFEGYTFYCMPPFTLLDVDTLKSMLEASGGRVVSRAEGVKASHAPALLLAEPAHTQENQYTFLALEMQIVPVNYEWALNCLGSYSICSLVDLLLCPTSILPEVTKEWPQELLAIDY